MSWIISSLLMFGSSIVFYLTVKKLQVIGVDKRIYTLANYIFPSFIFFVISIMYKTPLMYSLFLLVAIVITRVLFNYIGTILGYKSMEEAPNAGYSLIIQKSYAVYTLFAAALLFHSEISVYKISISGFILFCAFLVAYQRGKKVTRVHYSWVIYAVIAMLSFGTISLSSKYFALQGVKPVPQLFWTCFFTLLITGADALRVKVKSITMTPKIMALLSVLGISVSSFYYFKLLAEVSAPNLGYVGTINAASNAVYTVLVAVIFGDSLSWKKLLAVCGMTGGLILLLFS